MVRVWKGQYELRKTKHVQALNSNYIFIERIANMPELKSGLYYIEVDFHEMGPNAKLSEYIQTHSETELKPIIEYSGAPGISRISLWDVKGTPMVLAVSFVKKDEPGSTKVSLKVLTDIVSDWALCQDDDLQDNPSVNYMEMICPPHDLKKVYVLYSTSDGLDGGRH